MAQLYTLGGLPYMFNIDPFMWTGLKAFFIPTGLGCLSYYLATVMARPISSSPRQLYIGRLVILAVFIILIAAVSIPYSLFSGGLYSYLLLEVKQEGANYGMLTVLMWLVIALIKVPKSEP
jgi:uncharacterized membrane protein YbhN (UPF0104 family)